MLVSRGYPESYKKNIEMTGFGDVKDSILFHAGTKNVGDKIFTNGDRVLAVTSFGKDLEEMVSKSFENAEKIQFDGKYYRKDIGLDL